MSSWSVWRLRNRIFVDDKDGRPEVCILSAPDPGSPEDNGRMASIHRYDLEDADHRGRFIDAMRAIGGDS